MTDEQSRSAEHATVTNPGRHGRIRAAAWKRWIPRIGLAAVTLVSGVWIGAQLWPHWAAHREEDRTKTVSSESTPRPAFSPSEQIDTTPPNTGIGGTASSISETPSTLVLLATHPGRTPREGTASIGADPGNPQTFVAGALLANGSTLAEIHPNRVVLEKQGARATLFVMGIDVKKSSDATTTVPDVPEADRARFVAGNTNLTLAGGERKATKTITEGRDGRSGFLRVEQQVADGIVQGYRITPGANSAEFSRFGFQSGDILTAVDGSPVEKDADIAKFVASLEQGEAHSVTVKRGGNSLELSVGAQAAIDAPGPANNLVAMPPPL